jgi:hypothetical protein
MGCRGVGRREEACGVLDVARGLIVATLVMAGVAPTLVGGGKRGRREKASLGRPLALGHGYGLGQLERDQVRGREGMPG